MLKKVSLILAVVMMFAVLAGCSSSSDEITELTMGFIPSQDADKIADTVEPLRERLEEILGVPVRAQVMTDYTALIEGMRTKRIDIGFLAPFNFVMAEERANVQVILKAVRNGAESYRAQINARADLEAETLEDLLNMPGLVWAFADTLSASGYLFPASAFMDLGIQDLDSHFTKMTTGGHDNALLAILAGQADIATTFEDARDRVERDHADVKERIKVIGFTNPIPNDTISLRAGMSEEWVKKITDAFMSFNEDQDMMNVMREVYNWTGIARAQSSDYEIVRSTYARFKDQIGN